MGHECALDNNKPNFLTETEKMAFASSYKKLCENS